MEHCATFRRTDGAAENLLGLVRAMGTVFIFAVPFAMLLIWPSAAMPFIAGKTQIFRECALLAGAMAVIVATVRPTRISWPALLFAAFVAITLMADMGGNRPSISFSGTQQRMEGALTPITMFIYLAALPVLITSNRLWCSLIGVWAVSGTVAALSGVYQMAMTWHLEAKIPRVWGVMGQEMFLGTYLVLGVIFCLWQASLSHRPWIWVALALFNGNIMLATGTRSAILALLAGLLVIAPALPRSYWRVLAACAVVCATVFAAVQITDPWGYHALFPVANRLACWHAEMTFVHLRPWLGYGQEGLNVICNSVFVDRAHNIVIQMLADSGIIGGATGLLFLGVSLWTAWRLPHGRFAAAGVVAYTVVGMFEPLTVSAMAALMTFIGWTAFDSTKELAHG